MPDYVCKQCAPYKPATFATTEEAEEHIAMAHPGRFLKLYRQQRALLERGETAGPIDVSVALFNQAEGIPQ